MGTTGSFTNDFASTNRTANSKSRAIDSFRSNVFGATNTSFNINSSNNNDNKYIVANRIRIKNKMKNILDVSIDQNT